MELPVVVVDEPQAALLGDASDIRPRAAAQPFGAQRVKKTLRVARQLHDRQIELPEGAPREPCPELRLGRLRPLSPAKDGGHRVGQEALGRHRVEGRGRPADL